MYDELLNSSEHTVRQHAADAWMSWEDALISLDPDARTRPAPNSKTLATASPSQRLCAHYFSHGGWFTERQLIDNARRIKDIPAVLIHGRVDPQGSLETAWELSQEWPAADLIILDGAGHSSTAIGTALHEALERFGQ